MHTEHLRNVHPVRVLSGWLVSVAIASVAVFVFIALGLVGEGGVTDATWTVIAVAVGFFVGGWSTGMRTLEAPILHGIGLGLTSLVAWAALNLVVVVAFGAEQWTELGTTATLVMLLAQVVAAVAGCWVGTRGARTRTRSTEVSDSPGAGVQEREE